MDMSSIAIGRIPPQSIEAERSVLGSIITEPQVYDDVIEIIKSPGEFYREDHREIFDAIESMLKKGKTVDCITLGDELKLRGTLDSVGGLEYLMNMTNQVPTTANVKHYAGIVHEKHLLRSLIKIGTSMVDEGYGCQKESEEIISAAEKLINDVNSSRFTSSMQRIGQCVQSSLMDLEKRHSQKGYITGVPTGFFDLDFKTAGFQNSDLIIIAARPAMGKTSFGLNIAEHIGIMTNTPVAVFNLEMSKLQLTNRMICSQAMIDSHKYKTGNLDDEEWKRVGRVLTPLDGAPIYIDDNSSISVSEMKSKCRKIKKDTGLGLVVIDYLQLMQLSGKKIENRQNEISEISRSLKIMAKELDVPVVALSQLSRACESRQDKRPILSDLRESGAIEQDADLVMFLYRDDYYNPNTDKKNIAEVIISKNRNGSTGTVELVWLGQYTKFANIERFKNNAE